MPIGNLELFAAPPAEVVAIWLKLRRGMPMKAVDRADLIAGRGLVGNVEQGGRRQITIIDEAAWRAAAREFGVDVDPVERRANLMLRAIDLRNSRGRLLRVGKCIIRVLTETTPCLKLERARPGLRAALKSGWRGGVTGQIIAGGTIRIGDTAEWIVDEGKVL
jgi:MOSC domain-containing protein YiiM